MDQILIELYNVIIDRIEKRPPDSYTVQLVNKGIEYIAKKFGEESIEIIISALSESKERFVYEIADMLYHLLVLMAIKNVKPEDVMKELMRRRR